MMGMGPSFRVHGCAQRKNRRAHPDVPVGLNTPLVGYGPQLEQPTAESLYRR
jgi:hypothetical protein